MIVSSLPQTKLHTGWSNVRCFHFENIEQHVKENTRKKNRTDTFLWEYQRPSQYTFLKKGISVPY